MHRSIFSQFKHFCVFSRISLCRSHSSTKLWKAIRLGLGHLLELLHFNIIWLVHIIDSDELYFVTTTFRLLSKWLFNSVKWECCREFSSVACSLPTAHILTLLYLLDSFSFRECGAVDATNAQTHSHGRAHAIQQTNARTAHTRKWKFPFNGSEMETLKPNELAIKCLFVRLCAMKRLFKVKAFGLHTNKHDLKQWTW